MVFDSNFLETKGTPVRNYRNNHILSLSKAEEEILLVYDNIRMNGKLPSVDLTDKQIHLLQKRIKGRSEVNYLFTCC